MTQSRACIDALAWALTGVRHRWTHVPLGHVRGDCLAGRHGASIKAASGNLQTARLVIELRGQELERRAEEEQRALNKAKRNLNELTDEELMEIARGGLTKSDPKDSWLRLRQALMIGGQTIELR